MVHDFGQGRAVGVGVAEVDDDQIDRPGGEDLLGLPVVGREHDFPAELEFHQGVAGHRQVGRVADEHEDGHVGRIAPRGGRGIARFGQGRIHGGPRVGKGSSESRTRPAMGAVGTVAASANRRIAGVGP